MSCFVRMTALPRPDRTVALREAFRRAESFGPIRPAVVGLAAGLIASYVADGLLAPILSAPLRQLADSVVFVAFMAPIWLLVQPAAVRRAHDVMTWLNGWETEKIPKQLAAFARQEAFRMKLHAVHRVTAVANAHDFARLSLIVGPGA